jgi:hypothetical protein
MTVNGELLESLREMVAIYWADGDGIDPPPQCIQRAQAAISEAERCIADWAPDMDISLR